MPQIMRPFTPAARIAGVLLTAVAGIGTLPVRVTAGVFLGSVCPNRFPARRTPRAELCLSLRGGGVHMAEGSMSRKDLVRKLLKGIETGDPEAAAVVNEAKYIQHNPRTKTGQTGLAELFQRLAKTNPRVTIVRAFEDGDIVFAHTDYLFGYPEVGFEVFRFEGDKAVEHWDNLQHMEGPNLSGHTMLDGTIEVAASDLPLTETNRALVRTFVEEVLISKQLDKLEQYLSADYTEHNPKLADGIPSLRAHLSAPSADAKVEGASVKYDHVHRVLAEGDFVLVMSEGSRDGVHCSYFDMFRVAEGKLVEHWDTYDPVAPRSDWKNENGKW